MTFVLILVSVIVLALGNAEGARVIALLAIAIAVLEGANVIRRALLISPHFIRKGSS